MFDSVKSVLDLRAYRWCFWLATILIGITMLPYLYGFSLQTNELRFSGSFIGVEDQNSYLAKMRSGSEGRALFYTPYTAEKQTGIAAYLPFIWLGKLAAGKEITGQLQFLYQIMRIASIYFYVFSLYFIYSKFFKNLYLSRLATLMNLAGGGFGGFYFVGLSHLWEGRLPLEFYSPEAFSFLAILTLPHVLFARGFLILSLYFWFKGIEINQHFDTIPLIITVLCTYLIYIFQPITLLIELLIIAGISVLKITAHLQKKQIENLKIDKGLAIYFRSLVVFFILISPPLIYSGLLMLSNPFVKGWSNQNILTTAPLCDYALAYAGWICLAIFPLFGKLSIFRRKEIVISCFWIFSAFGLIYFPVSFQRRLIEGVWVLLIALAIKSVGNWVQSKKYQKLIYAGMSIFCLSSLLIWIGSFIQIQSKQAPVFIQKETLQLFEYLDEQFVQDQVVFAEHDLSNQIPVWTHVNSMIGLGPESIGESEILEKYHNALRDPKASQTFLRYLDEKNVSAWIVSIEKTGPVSFCNELYRNPAYQLCSIKPYE